MARDDIFNAITPSLALANTTNAALVGATVNGAIIDTQGETGGAFLVRVAGISAGSIALGIIAGDAADLSDGEAVTDPLLVQVSDPITAAGQGKAAYQGIKRYIRLTLTGSADLAGASAFSIYASAKQDQGALA
ncbi:hypothetical protein [Paracoccus versutus]|uniref:Uncharacterized protein n=1 Tax=Paracoccus versutus TaxID=34007 RepID=A0A3D9XGT0_PARVE|nr:hypothetical protein [Paracoccus versutus]REF69644.1 hypothetical protein BDD41_2354 [Paracoccus versutus]WGR57984.1 hypothetical protein E3U25_18780 [Paracoccus versutus]SFY21135.1 hypothetical protein SAMN04244548_03101 [Paracoccus pantotrophus]